MKRLFTALALFLVTSTTLMAQPGLPLTYAHRGCWLSGDVPENSVAAVEMARRYGYPAIECDVHFTKDSVMVIMHDYNNMKRLIRK
ncbi:MAG: hypothetical protein II746_00510, partial [Bacteroidaceae bacterium]|nr:hypothetical protein [Bacteroidaceae bacterium]